jgi:hypothetical protein
MPDVVTISDIKHWAGWCTGNFLRLLLVGVPFGSQLRHRLTWLIFTGFIPQFLHAKRQDSTFIRSGPSPPNRFRKIKRQPSYDSTTYNLTYRRRRRINHKHTNYKTKYPILDSLQITSHVTQCSTKPTAEPTLLQQWIFTCGRWGYDTV